MEKTSKRYRATIKWLDNVVHSDIGDYGDVFNIFMKVEVI